MAMRVLDGCREGGADSQHRKRRGPLEQAAWLTGVSRATLQRWTEKSEETDDDAPPRRGGNRCSADTLDPDAASTAEEIVHHMIVRRHVQGQAVTIAGMLAELAAYPEVSPFFRSATTLRRWLDNRGIIWQTSYKYSYLKSSPAVVARRRDYIFRLVQNR